MWHAHRGVRRHGQLPSRKADFLGKTFRAAERFGIAHERLDAAAIRARFPRLTGIGDGDVAYYEPNGGFVRPEACIAAQLAEARRHGARIETGTTVLAIRQDEHGVVVATADGSMRVRRVVVGAGAWNADLLGPPFDALLSVNRQVLHWFALDGAVSDGEPVIIWMHGAGDGDYFYGFPPLPEEGSQKFATEDYLEATTAETIERDVAGAESLDFFGKHISPRVSGVRPDRVKAAACLYTMTPDRGFILDWHPRMRDVFVISACSGHGFKHSAGIGEAVAEQLLHGDVAQLRPFSLARFEV